MSHEENDRPLPPELRERLESETSAEERRELKRVWQLLEQGRPTTDAAPNTEETWSNLQARLEADAHRPSSNHRRAANRRTARPDRQRRTRRRWAGIAATLIIAVLAAGAWLWQRPVQVSAPPGEHQTVSLPDGSSVELSSGSTLSYRRSFARLPLLPTRQRLTHLEGEAFFEIADGHRPFVVETFNARVEVSGTRFNVRSWPEDATPTTQVTLASGRVQVAAFSGQHVTLSQAGQSSRVVGSAARAPTTPQDTSVRRVLAWRRQGFALSNQPLSSIFAELERRFDLRISVQARTALSDSMTLFYPGQTNAEMILHDICVAKGLKYRATSQGYEIFRKAPADFRE